MTVVAGLRFAKPAYKSGVCCFSTGYNRETMITHDDILKRINDTWLEIMPSRKSLAKKLLPSQANSPSPNVVVVALPTDTGNLIVCREYRLKRWKPGFNDAHVPSDYRWQLVTPAGQRLLLFTWVNWRRNSRQLFEEFCRETKREYECRIIDESEQTKPAPKAIKPKSAKVLLATAAQLLKRRSSQCKELDCQELWDDAAAHDDDLQNTIEKNFRANFERYAEVLNKEYGTPTKTGATEHRQIPLNGVLRYATWTVSQKSLYLALSHEDRELPWLISLGIGS